VVLLLLYLRSIFSLLTLLSYAGASQPARFSRRAARGAPAAEAAGFAGCCSLPDALLRRALSPETRGPMLAGREGGRACMVRARVQALAPVCAHAQVAPVPSSHTQTYLRSRAARGARSPGLHPCPRSLSFPGARAGSCSCGCKCLGPACQHASMGHSGCTWQACTHMPAPPPSSLDTLRLVHLNHLHPARSPQSPELEKLKLLPPGMEVVGIGRSKEVGAARS